MHKYEEDEAHATHLNYPHFNVQTLIMVAAENIENSRGIWVEREDENNNGACSGGVS